jgi:hypothetical protein
VAHLGMQLFVRFVQGSMSVQVVDDCHRHAAMTAAKLMGCTTSAISTICSTMWLDD